MKVQEGRSEEIANCNKMENIKKWPCNREDIWVIKEKAAFI